MSRWRRAAGRVLFALLGGTAAVGLAELGFRARDDGTFPHLNCFVADGERAVRLEPLATERLRFGAADNPITDVRIGPEGYRGGGLPAPGDQEILVVGDSQVFGLGVQEDQTFAHVLELALRKEPGIGPSQPRIADPTFEPRLDVEPAAEPRGSWKTQSLPPAPAPSSVPVDVVNLGVPTYGPAEYGSVVEESLRTRHPKVVIYTLNLANDLFEASRRNVDRHAEVDGWAVRKENAPRFQLPFPFRRALLRRSHFVYALRSWWGNEAGSRPSEGTANDLLPVLEHGVETDEQARVALRADATAAGVALLAAQAKLDRTRDVLVSALAALDRCTDEGGRRFACGFARQATKAGAKSSFLDFDEINGEEEREVTITAEHLHRAALMFAYENDDARHIAELERDPALKKAADGFRTARAELSALRQTSFDPQPTVLTPELKRVAEACKARGIRLVVLLLPIDVVVSKEEWRKYGYDPAEQPDLSVADAFARSVEESARWLGAEVLDATPHLRAASPAAFLRGDLHMTPKGHDAVARALAELLRAEPELYRAKPMAEGVSSGIWIENEPALSSARMEACLPPGTSRPRGGGDEDCERTYSTCPELMACLAGNPAAPPLCRPGAVSFGDHARCVPRCAPGGDACGDGARCMAWRGVHGCVPKRMRLFDLR